MRSGRERAEYLEGIKEETSGMEDIACFLSHSRMGTLKLRPEAPPCLIARPELLFQICAGEGKSRGTQEGMARVNGKHCR